MKILVIGYGNPSRGDDGLGPALAQAVARRALPDVTVEMDYQLSVEDAATVAEHDIVVFADAALEGPEPFSFRELTGDAGGHAGFGSHHLEPGDVVALARVLYGFAARAFVLGLRGHTFGDFDEAFSEAAQRNLAAAETFLVERIRNQFAVSSCEVTP